MHTRYSNTPGKQSQTAARATSILPAGVYIHGRIINLSDLYIRFRKLFG